MVYWGGGSGDSSLICSYAMEEGRTSSVLFLLFHSAEWVEHCGDCNGAMVAGGLSHPI